MSTPATRMPSLIGSRARENERGSSALVAVLALELHEAADRQPVERVQRALRGWCRARCRLEERVAPRACRARSPAAARRSARAAGEVLLRSGLPRPRTLARGGKPMPNSSTRTFAQRAVMKWPSSWIRTSPPRITMNRTIVTSDWTSRLMRGAPPGRWRTPRGPRGRARPARATSGAWSAPLAEPRDRGLEQARDAREVQRAVEEPRHGDLVGRDQRGRRAGARAAGLAGDPERREARLVRARGSRAARPPTRSGGGRRRREAVGVRERVLDGKSHVRGAQLGLQRAVHELDGRVDDALRMDDDVDRVVPDIVQPVRLDHLQALVGEGRGVDRDLGAHRPRRVAQGLLRRDRGERRPASRRGTGRPTR